MNRRSLLLAVSPRVSDCVGSTASASPALNVEAFAAIDKRASARGLHPGVAFKNRAEEDGLPLPEHLRERLFHPPPHLEADLPHDRGIVRGFRRMKKMDRHRLQEARVPLRRQ